ncbi:MAG: hypothetical protein JO280_07270, partial [Mycobacteriaceae bacterium]|nr:hypothetical protein [Mycobacteriaceae bacterium]
MGRHSIPGPGDPSREPFRATPPPEQPDEPAPPAEVAPPEEQEPGPAAAAPAEEESTGGRFVGGTWQGGHRSTETKRRGVSIGVIVA